MTNVRLVHLSDPHFGTVLDPVRTALLDRIRTLKPDFCVISGDITQRAQRRQFEEARKFEDDLAPIPTFAIPGNHDIPLGNLFGRLLAPYRGFHQYFQTKREQAFAIGPVQIFCLNSTSRWRHIQGNLDINRVRGTLVSGSSESVVRIAAVHHPLACAKPIDEKNLLVNREAVCRLFEETGVDLVLSGHVHDPFVTLSDSRYTSKRPIVLSVAGTCLSWRTRAGAPNSFTAIEIETGAAGSANLTLIRNDLRDGTFVARDDWTFRFQRASGGGWQKLN